MKLGGYKEVRPIMASAMHAVKKQGNQTKKTEQEKPKLSHCTQRYNLSLAVQMCKRMLCYYSMLAVGGSRPLDSPI